jgi:hypothetical protein
MQPIKSLADTDLEKKVSLQRIPQSPQSTVHPYRVVVSPLGDRFLSYSEYFSQI